MLWGAMSHRGLGPLVVLDGRINAAVYVSILADHLHPMVQYLFPNSRPVFEEDNSPVHTAGIFGNWLDEHDDELQHLLWPRSVSLS